MHSLGLGRSTSLRIVWVSVFGKRVLSAKLCGTSTVPRSVAQIRRCFSSTRAPGLTPSLLPDDRVTTITPCTHVFRSAGSMALAALRGAALRVAETSSLRLVRPSAQATRETSWSGAARQRGARTAATGRSDDQDGHELSTHVSSDGLTPRMVDVGGKVSRQVQILTHTHTQFRIMFRTMVSDDRTDSGTAVSQTSSGTEGALRSKSRCSMQFH